MKKRILVVLLVLVSLSTGTAGVLNGAQQYWLLDLGTIAPDARGSVSPVGLNNHGDVAISWEQYDVHNGQEYLVNHAGFQEFGRARVEIAPLPEQSAVIATGLNDNGEVTCVSNPNTLHRGFVWKDGLVERVLPSGFHPLDINDRGVVAGFVFGNAMSFPAACQPNGEVQLLDVPVGTTTGFALAIDDAGRAVGSYYGPDFRWHAAFWDAGGQLTDLGPKDYAAGQALAFCGSLVVGSVFSPPNQSAGLWDLSSKRFTTLGSFGGDSCWANDINRYGQIVGSANYANGDNIGFVWKMGKMTDLNKMVKVPGRTITGALFINDIGMILCSFDVMPYPLQPQVRSPHVGILLP